MKDHVKQAWEHVKEEQDVEDDGELPSEEAVLGGAGEKKDPGWSWWWSEQPQARKDGKGWKGQCWWILGWGKEKSEEKKEAEDEEMDIGKFEDGKVRDAMEFSKWMEKVQFG